MNVDHYLSRSPGQFDQTLWALGRSIKSSVGPCCGLHFIVLLLFSSTRLSNWPLHVLVTKKFVPDFPHHCSAHDLLKSDEFIFFGGSIFFVKVVRNVFPQ